MESTISLITAIGALIVSLGSFVGVFITLYTTKKIEKDKEKRAMLDKELEHTLISIESIVSNIQQLKSNIFLFQNSTLRGLNINEKVLEIINISKKMTELYSQGLTYFDDVEKESAYKANNLAQQIAIFLEYLNEKHKKSQIIRSKEFVELNTIRSELNDCQMTLLQRKIMRLAIRTLHG